MSEQEVLEWWDYTTLRGYVFGPASEVHDIEELWLSMESGGGDRRLSRPRDSVR